jgi:deoxyribonuclease-1
MPRKTLLLILSLLPAIACCQSDAPAENILPGYLDTVPLFWEALYPDGGVTLYCGKQFEGNHGPVVNIEHVFPMSWVTKELGCGDRDSCRRKNPRFNRIESDMHNMYPSLRDVNKLRSSMPFSVLKGEKAAVRGCDFEVDYRSRMVEPRPAVRGEIARAMLYMADRYDLRLFKRQRELLERWHREDPATEGEIERNRIIKELQGSHNHYISLKAH